MVGPVASQSPATLPGTMTVSKGVVSVTCGDGAQLNLIEVQLPSRKPVSGGDFANGMRVQTGEQLS